jgi:hypothetical protein
LKECDKFIQLNGSNDLPEQILAQRDMIALERDYYRDETIEFGLFTFGVIMTIAIIGLLWSLFHV